MTTVLSISGCLIIALMVLLLAETPPWAVAGQVPIFPITVVENETATLPCYNTTVSDLAVGTQSQFALVIGNNWTNSSSSPYFHYVFRSSDNGVIARCEVLETGSEFNKRRTENGYGVVLPRHYKVTVLTHVTYYPPAVIGDPSPGETVTCPFVGTNLTVTFFMNTSGPYNSSRCYWCDAGLVALEGQAPGACSKVNDSACFAVDPGNSSLATVLPHCFGCLQCVASNYVNGTLTAKPFSFILRRGDKPPPVGCDNTGKGDNTGKDDIQTEDSIFYPSNNVTAGIEQVRMTLPFRSHSKVSVHIYDPNGNQLFSPGIEEISDSLIESRDKCQYSLTLKNLTVAFNGTWQLVFYNGNDILKKTFTLFVTDIPCKEPSLPCQNGGQCKLNWYGVARCVCPRNHLGPLCQYGCPGTQGDTPFLSSGEVIVPRGCHPVAVFNCVGYASNQTNSIYWYRDGQPIARGISYIYQPGVADFDQAGVYMCGLLPYNAATVYNNVTVTITSAPVLVTMPTSIELFTVTNFTNDNVTTLAIQSESSLSPAQMNFYWDPVDVVFGSVSASVCVQDAPTGVLSVPSVPCCSGLYRGTASNMYGMTSQLVRLDIVGTYCPSQPQILRSGVTDDGQGFVDIIADSVSVRTLWTSRNTSEQTWINAVLVNSSCCVLRATATRDLSGGLYNVCLFANQQQLPLLCSEVAVVASGSSVFPTWEIAGAVAALVIGVVITIVIVKRRKKSKSRLGHDYTSLSSTEEPTNQLTTAEGKIYETTNNDPGCRVVTTTKTVDLAAAQGKGKEDLPSPTGSAISTSTAATLLPVTPVPDEKLPERVSESGNGDDQGQQQSGNEGEKLPTQVSGGANGGNLEQLQAAKQGTDPLEAHFRSSLAQATGDDPYKPTEVPRNRHLFGDPSDVKAGGGAGQPYDPVDSDVDFRKNNNVAGASKVDELLEGSRRLPVGKDDVGKTDTGTQLLLQKEHRINDGVHGACSCMPPKPAVGEEPISGAVHNTSIQD